MVYYQLEISYDMSTNSSDVFVRLEKDVVTKLTKLGNMGQTSSDLIKKLVDHVQLCDIWWLEQDLEDKL